MWAVVAYLIVAVVLTLVVLVQPTGRRSSLPPRSRFPTVLDRIKAAYVEGRVEIDRLESDIATVLESGLADEESVATYPACMGPSLMHPLDAPLFDTPRLDRVV